MFSLAGELSAALHASLTKTAKEIVTHPEFPNIKKQAEEIVKKGDHTGAAKKSKEIVEAEEVLETTRHLEDVIKSSLKTALLSKPIKSIDELVDFLGEVDDTFLATDLVKVDIQVLFRGTTRSTDGSIFRGNTNSQLYGLSTSTDPLRAIIFGIESSSITGNKGFLQVVISKNLKNVKLEIPNRRYNFELEVITKMDAEDFAKASIIEIPIDKARELADKFFNLPEKLPTKLDPQTGEARYLMSESYAITNLENSFKFYQELLKLK